MSIGVALANRRGIALACDSAITVTSKGYNFQKESYLKSGNKLFKLSDKFPIGATVTSSSTINTVDVDTIFYDLKKRIDKGNFHDDFKDVFEDFLANLDENRDSYKFDQFLTSSFLNFSYRAILAFNDAANDPDCDDNIMGLTIDEIEDRTHVIDLPVEEFDFMPLLKEHTYEAFLKCIKKNCEFDLPEAFVEDFFTFLGGYFFYNLFDTCDSKILLIGYGNKDAFPRAVEFKYFGYWYGHHLYEISDESEFYKADDAIYFHNGFVEGADIITSGFNDKIIKHFNNKNIIDETDKLFEDILTKEQTEIFDEQLRNTFLYDFEDVLFKKLDNVKDKLFLNLNSFNVSELANVAEGLVKAECMRHKYFMDKNYKVVGEPIDVAVITRDGFTWIKNKNDLSEGL